VLHGSSRTAGRPDLRRPAPPHAPPSRRLVNPPRSSDRPPRSIGSTRPLPTTHDRLLLQERSTVPRWRPCRNPEAVPRPRTRRHPDRPDRGRPLHQMGFAHRLVEERWSRAKTESEGSSACPFRREPAVRNHPRAPTAGACSHACLQARSTGEPDAWHPAADHGAGLLVWAIVATSSAMGLTWAFSSRAWKCLARRRRVSGCSKSWLSGLDGLKCAPVRRPRFRSG
jgi:hypothetical protein